MGKMMDCQEKFAIAADDRILGDNCTSVKCEFKIKEIFLNGTI
jgi:hypothetical protein